MISHVGGAKKGMAGSEKGIEATKGGATAVLLVAFKKNEKGNAFWESQGFPVRDDLNYRNKALAEMVRIDPDYVRA